MSTSRLREDVDTHGCAVPEMLSVGTLGTSRLRDIIGMPREEFG
jgi:hypothetical protein